MPTDKIAIEEHFASPDTLEGCRWIHGHDFEEISHYLTDLHGQLLRDMDESGISMSILSLNCPAVQAIPDKQQALEVARRANDYLAEQVAKNPARFRAFAALPMQDPEMAAAELERCVKQMGFKGALVNGFSQVEVEDSAVYYDLPKYWPFWQMVESLDVPFYLHPRDALFSRRQIYKDHPWLQGSTWAFGVETSTHALRLMGSGLFDKFPRLTIIIGHLGETLPNSIWRIDHRISRYPFHPPAKKKFADYLRENFYVTTSGNFCTHTLQDTIAELGADRILFSADYPFERMQEAADWFDQVNVISRADWHKIARGNAEKLFGLGAAQATGA